MSSTGLVCSPPCCCDHERHLWTGASSRQRPLFIYIGIHQDAATVRCRCPGKRRNFIVVVVGGSWGHRLINCHFPWPLQEGREGSVVGSQWSFSFRRTVLVQSPRQSDRGQRSRGTIVSSRDGSAKRNRESVNPA